MTARCYYCIYSLVNNKCNLLYQPKDFTVVFLKRGGPTKVGPD